VKYILFTFFIIDLTLSGFSQQDTNTSSLDILLQQSKDKAEQVRKANQPHLKGIAYGGIGGGGNSYKQGFGGAFGLNFHYSFHTFNTYISYTGKSEEISSGFDYTPTLQSFNCGAMYGLGVYDKNISFSGGLGIGYTNTQLILYDPSNHTPLIGHYGVAPGYAPVTYSNVTGCAGLQLTFHGRFIGFTIQSLLNFSSTITNYAIIGGISIGVQ
jgi:hypothetical protein